MKSVLLKGLSKMELGGHRGIGTTQVSAWMECDLLTTYCIQHRHPRHLPETRYLSDTYRKVTHDTLFFKAKYFLYQRQLQFSLDNFNHLVTFVLISP